MPYIVRLAYTRLKQFPGFKGNLRPFSSAVEEGFNRIGSEKRFSWHLRTSRKEWDGFNNFYRLIR